MKTLTRVFSAIAVISLRLGASIVGAQVSPRVLGDWTESNNNVARPAAASILLVVV